MKRVRLAAGLVTLAVVFAFPGVSMAQGNKTARGTVTAMAGDSLTVKVGTTDMTFAIDSQTVVVARGAGTKSRTAAAAGQKGPALSEVVKTGEAVIVTYRETGVTKQASRVEVVSSAGAGGGSTSSAKTPAKTSHGTVKSVSGDSLTIDAAGKDMTFAIDSSTQVLAKGAGTKARATGGKLPITQVVSNGNAVSVTYRDMGGTLHASRVIVTATK